VTETGVENEQAEQVQALSGGHGRSRQQHPGHGTGTSRLRARPRISSPSSATPPMTRADSPENTVFTRSLRPHEAHHDTAAPSVTTESATEPNVLQSPARFWAPVATAPSTDGPSDNIR
jgi:hypothetical protein